MNYQTALVQLPLVRETASGAPIRTPAEVARVCADMLDLAQESFQVLTVNTRNKLLNRHLISIGLANASLVHPRETFRPAILDNATGIIVVHNHPGGDPTPSADDIQITKQLIMSGRILDILVMDHVVLARRDNMELPNFLSMRENGLCDFNK